MRLSLLYYFIHLECLKQYQPWIFKRIVLALFLTIVYRNIRPQLSDLAEGKFLPSLQRVLLGEIHLAWWAQN